MDMRIARRSMLAGAGAAAALPRVSIAQSMPELNTIRSTAKSWLWLAEDYGNAGGFFTKAGVKVISTASNRGTNVAALAGSGVDIVLGDPGEVMSALKENFGARSFVQTVGRYASHIVLKKDILDKAGVTEASPVAAKIAVLKGRNLGTTGPGAAPDSLFRWLAVKGGMDPNKDFRLVPIQGGGPGMVAGLQQNVIDGFCLSSPTSDLAVSKAGCAYLFNNATNAPPELTPYCYIIATTSDRGLRDKREALTRYVMGIALALRSISAEPDKFKAFAVPFLELDPSIAEPAFNANSKIYFPDPAPSAELFKRNVDFINLVYGTQSEPPVPASITFDKMYDVTLVQDAMKRL
jgi:ABC-type nitrate/sulfonate/bicarbonate transport system substrate-binding protein